MDGRAGGSTRNPGDRIRSFIEQSGSDFSANQSGKIKMVLQCCAVVASLWPLHSEPPSFHLVRLGPVRFCLVSCVVDRPVRCRLYLGGDEIHSRMTAAQFSASILASLIVFTSALLVERRSAMEIRQSAGRTQTVAVHSVGDSRYLCRSARARFRYRDCESATMATELGCLGRANFTSFGRTKTHRQHTEHAWRIRSYDCLVSHPSSPPRRRMGSRSTATKS